MDRVQKTKNLSTCTIPCSSLIFLSNQAVEKILPFEIFVNFFKNTCCPLDVELDAFEVPNGRIYVDGQPRISRFPISNDICKLIKDGFLVLPNLRWISIDLLQLFKKTCRPLDVELDAFEVPNGCVYVDRQPPISRFPISNNICKLIKDRFLVLPNLR